MFLQTITRTSFLTLALALKLQNSVVFTIKKTCYFVDLSN